MTLIIGANGSMGRRYQAIMKWSNRPFGCIDVNETVDFAQFESFILATPTDTHFEMLMKLYQYQKPVLCEKPVTKNLDELRVIQNVYKDTPFQMVMQYRELDRGPGGASVYDYYNHGKDGLYWDTMQIIGLARSAVHVDERSPIWNCKLNGYQLDLKHMDFAYIAMIHQWFRSPRGDFPEIFAMHEKVVDMIKHV